MDLDIVKSIESDVEYFKGNRDLVKSVEAVGEYFEGEYHRIIKLVKKDIISKNAQYQNYDDGLSYFDHCYVDQKGSNDDFHGEIYFHITDDLYLEVEY